MNHVIIAKSEQNLKMTGQECFYICVFFSFCVCVCVCVRVHACVRACSLELSASDADWILETFGQWNWK